jgi:hypothetical protein
MRRACQDPDRNSGTMVDPPTRTDPVQRVHCGATYDDERQSTVCPHESFGLPFPIACPYRDDTLVPA